MLATHIDSFKILEFFPYPSFVQFEISSYNVHEKRGDKQIMKLFESVLKKANEITGKDLLDNKIAFKISHISTETTLYIGYKDGKYTIGMDVWYEVPSKKRVIEESKTIDSIKEKEIDVEKEIENFTTQQLIKKRNNLYDTFLLSRSDINSIAKHFYGLVLKT